jgi:hypothetical protein
MAQSLTIGSGQQLRLNDPVVDWRADFSDTNPPTVVLTASVQVGPAPTIAHYLGPMATTLVVQMDVQVAIALYEKLGALGRSMGWLPQREGERPA